MSPDAPATGTQTCSRAIATIDGKCVTFCMTHLGSHYPTPHALRCVAAAEVTADRPAPPAEPARCCMGSTYAYSERCHGPGCTAAERYDQALADVFGGAPPVEPSTGTTKPSWAEVADVMADEPILPADAAWLVMWAGAYGRDKTDDNQARRLVGRVLDERNDLRREYLANHRALVARDTELAALREQLATLHDTVGDLRGRMACDSRDWAADRRDAWMYGVIVGWDCDETHDHDDTCSESALDGLAEQYGWNEQAVAKLRAQHAALKAGGAP